MEMARMQFIAVVMSILAFFLGSNAFAVDGWASENGGTTGGEGGTIVVVDNAADFNTYTNSPEPYIVKVVGDIDLNDIGGEAFIDSNTTITGTSSSSTITGQLSFVDGASNIIIEYLTVTNPNYYGGEGDGISVKDNITNLFVTKCTLYDTSDGAIDITNQSNYVTVSWCKFYYSTTYSHAYTNLVGSSDNPSPPDANYLKVTFHHNWYYTNCKGREPRVRFGEVHVYDNYFNTRPDSGDCIEVGNDAHLRVENNYFNHVKLPWKDQRTGGDPNAEAGWADNVYYNCTSGDPTFISNSYATIFTPPYAYTLDDANDLPTTVSAGAGNLVNPEAPNEPNGLTATAGNGFVLLDWNDNSEADVNGYNVYRSTTSGSGYTKLNTGLVTTSDYNDSGISPGTYYYVVTAVDTNYYESDYSSEVTANAADYTTRTFVYTYKSKKWCYDYDSNDGNWVDSRGTERGYFIIDVNYGLACQVDTDRGSLTYQRVYDGNFTTTAEQVNGQTRNTWLLTQFGNDYNDYSLMVQGKAKTKTIAETPIEVATSLKGKSINNFGSDPRYIEFGPASLKLNKAWTTQSIGNHWSCTQTEEAIETDLEADSYTETTDLTELAGDSNYSDLVTPDVNTFVYKCWEKGPEYSDPNSSWTRTKGKDKFFLVIDVNSGEYTRVDYDPRPRVKTYQEVASGTYTLLGIEGVKYTWWVIIDMNDSSAFALRGRVKNRTLGTEVVSVASKLKGYFTYDQGTSPQYIGNKTVSFTLHKALSIEALENDYTVSEAVDAVKTFLDGKGYTEIP
jgi:pectate lyase